MGNRLSLVVLLLAAGCNHQPSSSADAALPCACSATALARCVGDDVEACVDGQWQVSESCTGDRRCMFGTCRPGALAGCPDEARYDGVERPRERYAPVGATTCIPGGDIGRDVSYSETVSEERKRELRLVGVSGCADVEAGLPPGGLSAAFGVDDEATVTSSHSLDLRISGHLGPDEFGMFYRQTTRLERVATLWRQGQFVGLTVLTDWRFNAELAKGATCPPPTTMTPATWPACSSADDGCAPCSTTVP
jgi:hypothetical protein